jgi:hypothetical protein
MGGPVDPEKRQRALTMAYTYLGLRPGDIIRFECSFVADTDHFSVRIDYAPSRKGGYQILEGDLSGGYIKTISPVLGRGRVTPRFPLTPTEPVLTPTEIADRKRRRDLELEFQSLLDDERTS